MEHTLVLNASYEPINIISWKRALTLLYQGKVEVLAEYDREIRSISFTIKLPSVLRLLKYVKIRKRFQHVKFCRANIYARDNHICQYCGRKCSTEDLTFDHVIPRSRGGLSTWENLVACCHDCNRRKGNQLAHETNMKLLREPRPFNLHTSRHIMRLMGHSDSKWRKYLFY